MKANVKKKRKKGSNDELRELELELGHTNIDNFPKEKDTQRKEENYVAVIFFWLCVHFMVSV